MTAHHKGWFEFKICANNDINRAVTQECLDANPINLSPLGSGTKYVLLCVYYYIHLI